MNNRFKLLIYLSTLVFMVGCGKCEECDYGNNVETVCESEFDSPEQYQDAIDQNEIDGANCTATSGI